MQLRNKASRLEQSGFDFGGKSINEQNLKDEHADRERAETIMV